jgi:hypothetical protein
MVEQLPRLRLDKKMLKTINNDLIIIFLIVKNTCSSLLVIVINLVNIIYLFAIKLSLKSRSK